MSVTPDPTFRFFDTPTLTTEAFEIIFVIVGAWKGRTPVAELPFFSKVNFDRTVQELTNKGFQVSLSAVGTAIDVVAEHSK